MKKIANFLIDRRYIVLAIMLVLTIICGVLATTVPINKDRTEYLADDSNMKHGLAIMESAFPETENAAAIRVMFDDLTAEQITVIKTQLEAIPNVSSVTYEANDDKYNKDNHTLFVVNTDFDYTSNEEKAIEKAISERFSEYRMVYQNNALPSTELPLEVIAFALTLAVIILLVMSHSWLDPILFLATIGIAVVINMGTNAVLPYIDEMSATICPILQLVLSMDYSIILMSRYRQEKEKHDSKFDAMKTALAGSISSIASSSLTTVVGLLALVFLSFKLGPELGIVLAKGVFISMLCVFTVLPVMILAMDKWLEKTRKKALHFPMGLLAKFSYKARYVMPAIFSVLLIGAFVLQSFTVITFTENNDDNVSHIFPKDNTVVVIYDNNDEQIINNVISEIEKDDRISSVLGYSNTLGKEMNVEEMSDAINELGGDMQIDENIVKLLYFTAAKEELPTMTVSEFLNFLTNSVIYNETFSSYIDDSLLENVEYFDKFSDKEKLTTPMTAGEMADFFGIEENDIEQLYLYYTIQNGVADSGRMTLSTFVDFILNTVAKDETYGAMFDTETLDSLKQLQTYTIKDDVQKSRTASKLSEMLGIDESIVKIVFTLHNAGDVSDKTMTLSEFTSFLCDTMMQDATFGSYFDDATKSQIKTLQGLIQIAASNQSLSVAQMSEILGMDTDSITGLYYLYYINDAAFQQEVAATKMPLPDFLALLKSNASGDQLAQLTQMESLINLAVSGQQLDAASMAGITGLTDEQVSGIYMMNSAETMTLQNFLAAATQVAPDDAQLQQLNQIVQIAVSGTALNSSELSEVFAVEESQVYQLFGVVLSAQKNIALADFTSFLVNDVLTNESYMGNFTQEQAAQLQQMNGIVQLAASQTPLDANSLAQIFSMDANMITTVFRLYFGADIDDKTMSLNTFTDFILADTLMSSMMDSTSLGQLRYMQSIIHATVSETEFTSEQLAGFLGMETSQAEQLYILYMDKNGAEWKLSPQDFVAFAVTDVLTNEDFKESFDEKSAEDLKLGHTLVEAVVSEKNYDSDEMFSLLKSLTDAISENDIEVLYLYYGGINDTNDNRQMTIPQLFTFLSEELLNDDRFASLFDEKIRADIVSGEADLNDAIAQMRGDGYSRLVITSDYPDESDETLAHIASIKAICDEKLNEYYLVGNSVMVSEIDETFGNEYLMITLITAIAIFLVVLLAFGNPIIPLILTLIVQCGVFITVAAIGAYSGKMYYLALLIAQSILMGATIDYGIVFCNFYKESRKTMDVTNALKTAYESSMHTIMTSGSILVLVLAALGIFVSSAMISEVCTPLSIGVLIAILLILFVLPGMVACCDRLLYRKNKNQN